ncbi:MAG TPA: hypothetical protein VKH45_10255 [Candidatus Acidoferrum sp.]|nr:hypothetical protein [Candidatus Acidoferrum sp.]
MFPLAPDQRHMAQKTDVWQGTLALMVLKTLEALGGLHEESHDALSRPVVICCR